MKVYFQKKVLFGFIVAVAIIVWLAVSAYFNNQEFKETAHRVTHANRVLFHSEQILSLSIDLESGQRGYTITENEIFLGPYRKASEEIHRHLRDLKDLTRDNAAQQKRILQLESVVNNKLWFTDEVITARTKSFEEARDKNATLQGKKLMDEIRILISGLQDEEKALLKQRAEINETKMLTFNFTFITLLVVTIIILLAVFMLIHLNFKARTLAEESLKIASEQIRDIYDHAPCGYHSIDADGTFVEINQTWLKWLRYERQEVVNKLKFKDVITAESIEKFNENFAAFKKRGYISDVEFDVVRKDGSVFPVLLNATAIYDDQGHFLKSRSTVFDYTDRRQANERIRQLNQELEAFTYSVSHDLRAPLRSIDGYTRILQEDYAGKIDPEGIRIMNIVINNTRKMGQLIDDLLDFSRTGRKEITKAHLNMDNLVQSVFAELLESENGRSIDYTIHHLEPCLADPSLLRQVWTNLISNAIKYTAKKEKAVIEISSENQKDEIIYSIKDNGTGFDMQYAHKLFGVFQRLHRQQDFQGTGVGLAIVNSIISRHGGKAWAEGKVDEGAVFYFTLPVENSS